MQKFRNQAEKWGEYYMSSPTWSGTSFLEQEEMPAYAGMTSSYFLPPTVYFFLSSVAAQRRSPHRG